MREAPLSPLEELVEQTHTKKEHFAEVEVRLHVIEDSFIVLYLDKENIVNIKMK